ncbi:MCE family protein MceC [Nocardia nova SH22a]|uniref:MCE family protein MceC n=1 Tax=Nocardia nova SH22a TaxID=1415166 RepID=W5TKJ4_9NOCA|nr:MCE family protein [Nocardia nova]AHH17761.1 MCE family protein MceC [Nocardia nova SH22a]
MQFRNRFRAARTVLRRPLEDHRKSSLGIAALTVLALVLGIVVAINSWSPGDRRYDAEFAQAAGIRTGDSITVAGVPVGTVTAERLAGDRVVVGMRIRDSVRLGRDTRAAIKLTTLLGSRYIELKPAGPGGLPRQRIPLAQTTVPYDLQQALQDATVSFDQLDAGRLGTSLDTLAAQLRDVPGVLPDMLHNIQTLAGILGEHRDQLGSLLTGTRQLTTVVTRQQATLATIVGQGRDLMQQIITRRDAIETLMTATTRLVTQLRALTVDDRPELDRMLSGLDGFLGSLSKHDDLIRNFLQILPVPVRNFTNATGTGNELDVNDTAGPLIDSFMCALSGRAGQLQLPPYLQDCK